MADHQLPDNPAVLARKQHTTWLEALSEIRARDAQRRADAPVTQVTADVLRSYFERLAAAEANPDIPGEELDSMLRTYVDALAEAGKLTLLRHLGRFVWAVLTRPRGEELR